MLDKNEIIRFFDRCAQNWDEEMIRNDDIIATILDNAGVKEHMDVLDVACGTGVLFGDYLKRNVSSVTGIDISPEMIKRARRNFPDENIALICDDIETAKIDRSFDVVMVYNAFPHFPDAEALIKKLSQLTKPGGKLSIAHGMSRERIDAHHSGSAKNVSNGLMHADDLAGLLEKYFIVDTVISDSRMYQLAGTKQF